VKEILCTCGTGKQNGVVLIVKNLLTQLSAKFFIDKTFLYYLKKIILFLGDSYWEENKSGNIFLL